MAKQQQDQAAGAGAGGMADMLNMMGGGAESMAELQKMIQESLQDPETQKYLEQMGSQLTDAMETLSKMSPEEIHEQMKQAFDVLGNDDMISGLIEQREQVIQNLEGVGIIPPEELARMKADPQYFELKMRESFDQMKDVFNSPDMMKGMAEAMGGMKELMDSGDALLGEMAKLFDAENNDETIEEARLEILRGGFSDNPMFKEFFGGDDVQELLKDPVKWRKAVKDGQEDMKKAMPGDEL